MDKRIIIFLVFLVVTGIFLYSENQKQEEPASNSNMVTGQTFVTTHARVYADCFWRFRPGWSHISICLNISDPRINETLQSIEGEYRFVLRWNATTQQFDVYSPLSSQNPFDELSTDESFFIYYNEPDKLVQNPDLFWEDVSVGMPEGWYAVPYPYEFTANIIDLENFFGDYRFLLKWNYENQNFDVYSPLSSQNTISEINAGEGFMLYLNNPYTLSYVKSSIPR